MAKLIEKLYPWKKAKRPEMTVDQYLDKLNDRGLDQNGHLIPDPVPIAPPIGYRRQPTMVEIIREMVASERLAAEARAAGAETFEESEDFDVGDEPEQLQSGWENDYDPPIQELIKAGREALAEKEAAKKPSEASEKPAEGGRGGRSPPGGQPVKERSDAPEGD